MLYYSHGTTRHQQKSVIAECFGQMLNDAAQRQLHRELYLVNIASLEKMRVVSGHAGVTVLATFRLT